MFNSLKPNQEDPLKIGFIDFINKGTLDLRKIRETMKVLPDLSEDFLSCLDRYRSIFFSTTANPHKDPLFTSLTLNQITNEFLLVTKTMEDIKKIVDFFDLTANSSSDQNNDESSDKKVKLLELREFALTHWNSIFR